MLLSAATFDRLTSAPASTGTMECDLPGFPTIVFNKSEDGESYVYKDERLSIVVVPRLAGVRCGSMHVSFYRRGLSNFSPVFGISADADALPPTDLGARTSSSPLLKPVPLEPLAAFFHPEPVLLRTNSVAPEVEQEPELLRCYSVAQEEVEQPAELLRTESAPLVNPPLNPLANFYTRESPPLPAGFGIVHTPAPAPAPARTFAPCEISGTQVNFHCGEQMFKLACVLLHIDSADTKGELPQTRHNLNVLDDVMTAPTPLKCKLATGGINGLQGFNPRLWDKESLWVMGKIQEWKFMDPAMHAFVRFLALTAAEHDISQRDVFYYEAAERKDLRWGTGLSVDQMHDGILADIDCCLGMPDSFEGHIHDRAPVWEDSLAITPHFDGSNGLGKALRSAHLFAMGPDGEFINDSVKDYVERAGKESTIFCYLAPEDGLYNKRPRTDFTCDPARSMSSM